MGGLDIYTDQIWIKSDCQKYYLETNKILKALIKNKNIHSMLIDEVKSDYQTYQLVVTDNIIKNNFQYQALWPEFWGAHSYTPEYQNVFPSKLFSCFINRTCPIRQSWFYQLVRRNLLNDGWVSFMLDYRNNSTLSSNSLAGLSLATIFPPIDTTNKISLYDFIGYHYCIDFIQEHNQMKDYVPYRNFNISIDDAIIDSKISVIIETYVENKDIIAFSEKIFRGLQLPRPFLLFCAHGAVDVLRSQGFDVYDDIVNHDYDLEPNLIERQIKILNEIENCKEIVYTQDMLDDFERRAQHNRQLLRQLKQQWPDKLKKTLEAIEQHK